MMRREIPAESPEAYVETLSGSRRDIVEALRSATLAAVRFFSIFVPKGALLPARLSESSLVKALNRACTNSARFRTEWITSTGESDPDA